MAALLEVLLKTLPGLDPLTLLLPFLAMSSLVGSSSGLMKLLASILVADRPSRSSLASAASWLFTLADTWKLFPHVGRVVVAA